MSIIRGIIASSIKKSTLLTNISSYWKLDETGAGANAVDQLGLTTLTNTNCTTNQTGKIGKSFLFNGATPSILGQVDTTYEYTDVVSVNIWILANGIVGSYMGLIGDASGSGGGYDLNLTDLGHASWSVYNPAATPTGIGYDDNVNLVDSAWHMVTATFDGTNARLYVDGSKKGTSAAWAHAIAYGGTERFDIGSRGSSGGIPFTGYMDEAAIWHKALSDTEVTILYNLGYGETYPF